MENEEYNCRSKDGFTGVFSRDRKLNFKTTVVFISRGVKSSLQMELDSFYKEVTGGEFNIREVTKGAFTQARSKLSHEVFIKLNESVNNTFYSEAPYLVWNNMRLLSVDGTRLVLPNHKSVIEEFGEHGFGPNADSKRSLAMGSFLYDPINMLTLDSHITSYASSERELLFKHFEKVQKGDLLLLDRGYPSIALIFLLKAKGIQFCMRMKENWWLNVKEFLESGRKQQVLSFRLPKKDRELLKDYPEMFEKVIKCRLVSVVLPNGEKEILCTSLMDSQKYSVEDIAELYHYRWNEEEGYKLFKARMEVENFSGKTALAVKQNFFAKVFIMSLCANLAFPIEEKVKKEYEREKDIKHPQKINRTNALLMTREICIGLFFKNLIKKALKAFDEIVKSTREIIRPNRKNVRKQHQKKLYHMNYKRL
ncbi:MAG: IS4 family transposase [candidate division Zixibacteria bacterium]|nr:IS4 family transposase [candidate division Zixibacteria bacterium]